ncbi:MAG: DUF5686 family protein [Paludibacter sp.]|nr:DUF5686 family protein [Paludibacter sp.]
MNTNKIILYIIFTVIPFFCYAETGNTIIKGKVIDQETKEPLPYVSIYFKDLKYGTATNPQGEFSIDRRKFLHANALAKVTCVGYKPEYVEIDNEKEIVIKLDADVQNLQECEVKKTRYHKKDNPAIDLIEKVIENKENNNKKSLDYYDNKKYEKVQFAINHITSEFQNKKVFKRFQFVFENIDSLKNNGDKILPVYLKETISKNYYQSSPHKEREIVDAHKVVSFAGFDNKGIEDNIKYLYQNINIYDNNITFLSNQFLSPIAGSAPIFYRYYILDTIQSGAEKYVRMYFGTRNKEDLLFQGYLYVMLDGTYAVRKIEMSVNKNINMNWIDDVKIVQEFQKTENNYWMLSTDQLSMNFGISKKGRGLYGQKIVRYSDYHFSPTNIDSIYNNQKKNVKDSARLRTDEFWETHRPEDLTESEAATYTAMDSVQNVPVFKRFMNYASVILFGYYDMGKFEIGPVNTFYMYNPVEGLRFRFGGRTTNLFSKKINLDTYLAYGFTDERLKYYLGGTYSFTNRNLQEFPVKSLKVSIQNETQLPGQQMQFLMEDNFLLSIKRGVNDKLFYNKTFNVEHLNEFENHFSYKVGYKYTKMAPGGNMYFNFTDYTLLKNDVNDLDVSEMYLNLRYAPHESFYQGKTFRIPYYNRYPIFELRYTAGLKMLGNDYNYQTLRLNIKKRFFFSVLGYSDVVWEAGKIFGKVPYPLLNIPQANQTYSYQIESYNMMNFLEFVSDQYSSLLIDHTFNGFFFNKIPVVKHWNLREMLSCKILYGSLSNENNPQLQNDLFQFPVESNGTAITYTFGQVPYIEGSIGVGNIFKVFRVDLVRRFTYLDNPNVSKYGIRMRFRLDF